MVKILMLSKWHVHAEYYGKLLGDTANAKITCVWDDDIRRGEEWARELNVDFEPDLDKALGRGDVDAVFVNGKTTQHKELIVKAANAKKHVYTEKVLAPTLDECREIAHAVKENGINLGIELRKLTTPFIQYCKNIIDEGKLGKVHFLRIRLSHDRSLKQNLPSYWYDKTQTGGGAIIDLVCHSAYTALHLLGKPVKVTALSNNIASPGGVEDNSVVLVEFESKAIAVLESTFISLHQKEMFELLGTEGSIVKTSDEARLFLNDKDKAGTLSGKPVKPFTSSINTKEYTEFVLQECDMPKALPEGVIIWINSILNNESTPFDLSAGIALTELIESAYTSSDTGTTVSFS